MRFTKFSQFRLSEAAKAALQEKADAHDVPVEVLLEVFNRGVVAWDESTQKTEQQYAFNRVDSFLNGGTAAQLDEDLISELSPATLTNYTIKAAANAHVQRRRLNARAENGVDATKPYVKMKNREFGIKKASVKVASKVLSGIHEDAEQLNELSVGKLTKYAIKASASTVDHDDKARASYTDAKTSHALGHPLSMTKNMEDAKSHIRKMVNRHQGVKKATEKIASKVVTVDTHEETRLTERTEIDPAQYVALRDMGRRKTTKSAEVVQRHTQKERGMHDTHRTDNVLHHSFKKGEGDKAGHLTDKEGHRLTNRTADERKRRLAAIRQHIQFHENVNEGAEYIENRMAIHDAHSTVGRQLAVGERNPELRQIHMHRAKKHEHARRVLDILKSKLAKK